MFSTLFVLEFVAEGLSPAGTLVGQQIDGTLDYLSAVHWGQWDPTMIDDMPALESNFERLSSTDKSSLESKFNRVQEAWRLARVGEILHTAAEDFRQQEQNSDSLDEKRFGELEEDYQAVAESIADRKFQIKFERDIGLQVRYVRRRYIQPNPADDHAQ